MTDATGNDEAAGLGMLPLAAVCEAAGVNESLVATLYEEVVNEEPETVGFRAAVGLGEDIDAGHEDEGENEPHRLLAVGEDQLDASRHRFCGTSSQRKMTNLSLSNRREGGVTFVMCRKILRP